MARNFFTKVKPITIGATARTPQQVALVQAWCQRIRDRGWSIQRGLLQLILSDMEPYQ